MDIASWLRGLGLEQYEQAFRENAIDADVLSDLTDSDLRQLGILLGHRKRLLKAIAELERTANRFDSTAAEPVAERRQLTVMFVDLVGSTALSSRLDVEDLREIIGAFHRCVADTIAGFSGFVAKYMGDGVLIYFGYPQARENDAEQAVRAGLALVDTIGRLQQSEPLRVRVGIATGQVVVGDLITSDEGQERGVVGETPNLAARLQALAEPDAVLIAPQTRQLLGELFQYRDLGAVAVKGFPEPIRPYQVVSESAVDSRFEALHGTTPPSLIGREEELEVLLRQWHCAKNGEGRVVLLSGEPGIGKSRLAVALQGRIQNEPHTRLRYFCSPHRQDSALHPTIAQLERAAGFEREDTPERKLDKLVALLAPISQEDGTLLAELLSLPTEGRFPPLQLTPQRKKEKTFEVLIAQLEALSRHGPVLMLFEDVHWLDPSSRELLDLVIETVPRLRVLLLVTFRPEFEPTWTDQAHVTMLLLNRLGPRDGAALVEQVVGSRELLSEIAAEIVERTDGVPLFIEELTKAVLESGDAHTVLSHAATTALNVPATLQASLMARLDRLGSVTKEVAQVGAVLGREFSYELLAAIARRDATELDRALDQLVTAGLASCRGTRPLATYLFKHALVQDVAYGTLLRGKRQELHRRVAIALEEQWTEIMEVQPELLAHHLQEAGDWAAALERWQQAGEAAVARAATREAVSHFASAIECSKRLGDVSGGAERVTRLHLSMANALMQAQGYRSERLGKTLEDAYLAVATTHLVKLQCEVVISLAPFHFATGRNRDYLTIADERQTRSADLLPPAYLGGLWAWKGVAHFNRGEQPLAAEALSRSLDVTDRIDPGQHILLGGGDQRVVAQFYLSNSLIFMGFVDAAVELKKQIAGAVDQLDKPFDRAWHFLTHCDLCALFGQYEELLENAAKIVEICERHGYTARRSSGLRWRGVARWHLGELEAGIEDVLESLLLWRGQGVVFHTPYRACILCDLLLPTGRIEDASRLLDDVDGLVSDTDEACCLAECARLRGQIAAERGDLASAARLFETAIAIACRQHAKLFELRAITQLAPVLARQGHVEDAAARLRAAVDLFDARHQIVDLIAAQSALDMLCS
ncbi:MULTISPECIES: adenylate/guanylate cyclase domain-containing protein [Rhizobium]|uniref:adenylate/guanylate cyclase domain-containing protein n=1 Tax=Rhizobium TaxID=379 RepID=UPI0007E9EFCB|nr:MULTISPECIES: adenylate/guanylate cyclase domain-containing protein [Rhizobium]ANK90715.1 adenylate/guanylate cyclase protein [Rhizobium sp. N6212]ANK96744.1 adenylate/guanylate cyclase protein [Rhizobium sp. N621]ANL02864.1 adenylate/guanylate cyclase protein [Rhizobium esperanzae]ANL08913.1 adenylate/guanylate cyclase protein [Rhizobium sp. N1341]ANL20960.1 adenylate/guanylate cyclase protein [Rhizobium sp. N113]